MWHACNWGAYGGITWPEIFRLALCASAGGPPAASLPAALWNTPTGTLWLCFPEILSSTGSTLPPEIVCGGKGHSGGDNLTKRVLAGDILCRSLMSGQPGLSRMPAEESWSPHASSCLVGSDVRDEFIPRTPKVRCGRLFANRSAWEGCRSIPEQRQREISPISGRPVPTPGTRHASICCTAGSGQFPWIHDFSEP